jgi:hypothetical protein
LGEIKGEKMTNTNNIYRIINDINLSMAMEDMPLTSQNKQTLYDCIVGRLNAKDVLQSTIEKYTVN